MKYWPIIMGYHMELEQNGVGLKSILSLHLFFVLFYLWILRNNLFKTLIAFRILIVKLSFAPYVFDVDIRLFQGAKQEPEKELLSDEELAKGNILNLQKTFYNRS